MKKGIIVTVLFVAFALATGSIFKNAGPVEYLDGLISDGLIRYFSPETRVSEDIVIIFLDEATMKEQPYRSPVPRDLLFQINERILAAGPKAVGYDIFFKDPTIAGLDERLADSFKKGPVFGVTAGKQDDDGRWFEDRPMPLFMEALKGAGLSDLPFSSSDSTVRFAQFDLDMSGSMRPSFVAALYNAATGGNAEAALHDPNRRLSISGLAYSPYRIVYPGDRTLTRICYVGPPSKIGGEHNQFRIFPANLVAEGLIPPDWLKDKIVLVGAAYDDGTDAYITPYYSSRYNYARMPGVEIHANMLNSLLTKQFYYEIGTGKAVFGFIVIGLISSVLFLFGPVWRGAAGLVLLTVLLAVKTVLAFHYLGIFVPFVQFEVPTLLTFGAAMGYRSATEGRQKRFIKNVFAKYVPPSVVERMISNPKLLTLGGEQREITCLFTDIASFTTISEGLDPKTLVLFLNEYLDSLTRVIFKHGGTLDKYEGDAIIAFFGAPMELPEHRRAGVLAAIEIQKASSEISSKWREICGRDIETRVGINSGPAVVGNMGSDLRFDYTAIGDTVNLASRLEGANKFFGTNILASGGVVRGCVGGDIVFKPVARIKVKGKNEPVDAYEVKGMASDMSVEEASKINNGQFPKDIVELEAK